MSIYLKHIIIIADKAKVLLTFAFLRKILYISMKLPARDSCPICMETFEKISRQIGSAVNQSVQLPSRGHIFCTKCLARVSNFSPIIVFGLLS